MRRQLDAIASALPLTAVVRLSLDHMSDSIMEGRSKPTSLILRAVAKLSVGEQQLHRDIMTRAYGLASEETEARVRVCVILASGEGLSAELEALTVARGALAELLAMLSSVPSSSAPAQQIAGAEERLERVERRLTEARAELRQLTDEHPIAAYAGRLGELEEALAGAGLGPESVPALLMAPMELWAETRDEHIPGLMAAAAVTLGA